jgi:hypothetical protein
MKTKEVLCDTCKHFSVRTCCDRPVCAEQVWDDHAFTPGSNNLEEFLLEHSKDCEDYERDEE